MPTDDRFRSPKPNQMPAPKPHAHVLSSWAGSSFPPPDGQKGKEIFRYCLVKGCPEVETKVVP